MSKSQLVDGALVEWGTRLFYPGNRMVHSRTPRLAFGPISARMIRERIEATVRRAPQVMVKVTGGGRGMKAIAAHFRYISKNGRLDIEDDRGVVEHGKEVLRDLQDQWRLGGSLIDDVGSRREALNIMLSMPHGTDPLTVLRAAREFAKDEFADHRYVMVLHGHQANPHVHLSVKIESNQGKRLNPHKADLHRWRESFAERLRGWGIDAEATRQPTRGRFRRQQSLWQVKARADGRLLNWQGGGRTSSTVLKTRQKALDAWKQIGIALASSDSTEDRQLARDILAFLHEMPLVRQASRAVPDPSRTQPRQVDLPLARPDLGRDR
jgi:hypothetical protein